MSAPTVQSVTLSPATIQQRLEADMRQLSKQQGEAPPPTIDFGLTLDELAVVSDSAQLRRAQLDQISAGTNREEVGSRHVDVTV